MSFRFKPEHFKELHGYECPITDDGETLILDRKEYAAGMANEILDLVQSQQPIAGAIVIGQLKEALKDAKNLCLAIREYQDTYTMWIAGKGLAEAWLKQHGSKG